MGSSSHGAFKVTRHSSYSCGSGRLVPLSLPLMINSDDVGTLGDDVGTLGDDVSHGGGDVVLTTTDVVVIVCLVVEGTIISTLGMCTVRLFSWPTRRFISCSALQAR